MCSARSPVVALAARSVLLVCAALLVIATGCTHATTASANSDIVAPPTPLTVDPSNQASPLDAHASDTAASTLTAEARTALERGELEQATTLLERAIALRPDDGEACYWLAEVWWQRGEPAQAQTYHGLAVRFLGEAPAWRAQIDEQRARVGDASP
jgi:Tfp pilus assembly protein PilF